MTSMDVKGVSWVGGMYQRFEALCVDVDEAIYEDTVKYVGNQMRNVGDTVKKFYSEVMDDLLVSSSLDSVKDKDAASGRMVKDSAAVNGTVNCGPCYSAEEQCTLKDSQSQCTEFISSTQTSFVDRGFNSWQNSEYKSLSDVSNSDSSMKDFGEDSTCSGAWNELDGAFTGCGDLICKDTSLVRESQSKGNGEDIAGDLAEGFTNAGVIVIQGSTKLISVGDVSAELDDSVSSIKAVGETAITRNVQNLMEFSEDISMSDTGASNLLLAHEIESGGADDEGTYLNEQFDNFKLEGSCVLVDKNEQFFKSAPEVVQKSYKKKIKEVFSARIWSKSKKDQEQLASWYEEQCGKRLISTSNRHGELQKSQTSETLESEWELL